MAGGSSEGVRRARLLGLVDRGQLDGRKPAIVTPPDPTGAEFRRASVAVLATRGMRPVALEDADTVLEPTVDLGALPSLESSTSAVNRKITLDVYGFDAASASIPDVLDVQPTTTARQLHSVHLYAFSPVSDPSYRAREEPNTFSSMCNRAAADEHAARGGTTTTTAEPQPPLDPSYLSTANVCLLMRIATRGLFAAGPTLDQRALITRVAPVAVHRPDRARRHPEATAEPDRERTSASDRAGRRARPGCSWRAHLRARPSTAACWRTAPGWDDGGVVVNVPLATSVIPVSH